MHKEVIVVNMTALETGGWRALISPSGRPRNESVSLRAGSGNTEEEAIGKALGRPRIRFACDDDERQSQIAAFRGRAFTVMAEGNEMCHIGLT